MKLKLYESICDAVTYFLCIYHDVILFYDTFLGL